MPTLEQEVIEALELSPIWENLTKDEQNDVLCETCILWENLYSKRYICVH